LQNCEEWSIIKPTSGSSSNDLDDLGPVLKVKEAAKLLRVSEYKVRDLVKRGKLPGLKDGRTFRIYTEALRRQLLGQGG
jgi:excisionase family DNA binding protein